MAMQVCKVDKRYGHAVDHLSLEEAARRISQRRNADGEPYVTYEAALAQLSAGDEVQTYAYGYIPTP